ncbi:MAG: hypothetical protein RIR33_3707 [Pseudomonadota bacterium]|jgi:hypothetical protein
MANTNAAFGGRPVASMLGAPYNGQANTYTAPASYATDLFIGDPVVVTGARASGHQVVNLATAGATNQITGFIVGFEPTPGIVSLGYGAASTLRFPIVADSPELLFELQEDAVGGAIAEASIGLNVQLVSGSGSTATKKSGWMIDSSTVAADATYQLTIRDIVTRVDNEEATAYAKYLCSINLHTRRLGAVAGI